MQTLERTAFIDLQAGNWERFSACLSDAELARLNSYRTLQRRRQSLGARLCLKYLFLLQMTSDVSDKFFLVREDELNRFPAWLYRKVSAIPGIETAIPKLTWCGACFPEVGISLSHSRSLCCGGLAMDRGVGVDVETVEEKTPEFYRDYFTEAERAWVARQSSGITQAWLYTVLWSLKECALKAIDIGRRGYSSLAAIEVAGFPDLLNLMAAFESEEFIFEPSRFAAVTRGPDGLHSFDCELAGDRYQVAIVVRQKSSRGWLKHHDA
jgi:hypothetical protein